MQGGGWTCLSLELSRGSVMDSSELGPTPGNGRPIKLFSKGYMEVKKSLSNPRSHS